MIESPGHTDRDISFFHRKSGLAYLGDVVIKLRKGFCPPIPVKQPEDYKATLDRLAEYPIKEVLLAHGGRTAIKSDDFLSMKSAISATPKNYEGAVDVVKSVSSVSGDGGGGGAGFGGGVGFGSGFGVGVGVGSRAGVTSTNDRMAVLHCSYMASARPFVKHTMLSSLTYSMKFINSS